MGKNKNMALDIINSSDAVIFARHESGSGDYVFTYVLDNVKCMIISSEKLLMHSEVAESYNDVSIFYKPKRQSLLYVK